MVWLHKKQTYKIHKVIWPTTLMSFNDYAAQRIVVIKEEFSCCKYLLTRLEK